MSKFKIKDTRDNEIWVTDFEGVKNFFKPVDDPIFLAEWEIIEDLYDLEQFLKNSSFGMSVPFEIEEI